MDQQTAAPRILIFHHETVRFVAPGFVVVSSPLICLYLAVEAAWQELVVSFFGLAPALRPEVLELCTCLRRGRTTRAVPLTAVLPDRHRALLAALGDAGVERVDYLPPEVLSRYAPGGEALLPHAPRIADELASICPHVHYQYLDPGQEIVCCAARGGTLILSGRRLQGTCFSPEHGRCESFLSQRTLDGENERPR